MTQIVGLTAVEPKLTVGDVATASDVATSAVRFYEEHGIVQAARTATNQRRFHESASCRIKVAKLAQRVGLTVREIAEVLADLPPDPQPEDWARVTRSLVTEAEDRLRRLRAELEQIESGRKLCDIAAP